MRLFSLVLILASLAAWLQIRPANRNTPSLEYLASLCERDRTSSAETLVPTPTAPLQEDESQYSRETVTIDPVKSAPPFSLGWRIGVGIPDRNPLLFSWPDVRPGWYLNWSAQPGIDDESLARLGFGFAPMVRIGKNGLVPDWPLLHDLAGRNPGRTWLIGNEPDVLWQDGATAEEYACYFGLASEAIRRADPTAIVGGPGISQVTPLRLDYLDAILESYRTLFQEEIQIDVWTIHTFVLREDIDDWGVGLPPGFEERERGLLWDIEDHDNLTLVENQVRLMRRWMEKKGQREKPLYVTEYGILMPEDYGFSPSRTIDFMIGSFDLFRRLRDPEMGYSPDDNRLVQRWVWFSSRYALYPTGNLFDANGEPRPLMRAMSGYLRAHATSPGVNR